MGEGRNGGGNGMVKGWTRNGTGVEEAKPVDGGVQDGCKKSVEVSDRC